MDSKTQHGYLVLADISGYTSFVAATELEHAHDILTELLELILGQLTPTLTLSKLEGDAVFAYAPEARLPRGETVLELVEATYVAFRDRQEAIRRRTTCQCNACRSIPALDLKFIVHHGDFIAQRVAGIHELVGSDVNLIHRLSKNHVAEATGWRAYAMFTEAGLAHMGLRPEGMHEQAEAYEHLGQVQTYSLDLRARYAALVDARRVVVAPEDAHNVLTTDVPAPMAEVWSLLNEPRNREEWEGIHIVPVSKVGGRTGAGARSHCMHGDNVSMVETVLDWRPFDYFTVEQNSRGIPGMIINITYKLTQTPTGTRTERRERWMGSGFGPLYKFLCYWMDVIFGIKKGFEQRLKQLAAQADKPETGG
ncbi:MAG: DUF2652 domain-containing protein [Chloroflexi bacterium]|nr:DUF2652 domain-containing protein [Chloroflexota bacterium]